MPQPLILWLTQSLLLWLTQSLILWLTQSLLLWLTQPLLLWLTQLLRERRGSTAQLLPLCSYCYAATAVARAMQTLYCRHSHCVAGTGTVHTVRTVSTVCTVRPFCEWTRVHLGDRAQRVANWRSMGMTSLISPDLSSATHARTPLSLSGVCPGPLAAFSTTGRTTEAPSVA